MAMNVRAIRHGELQLAQFSWGDGGDAEFLLGFADCRFERCFTYIDFPAWAIDFPSAEAPLLFDQQNLTTFDDEKNRRVHLATPGSPVNGRWVLHGLFDHELGFGLRICLHRVTGADEIAVAMDIVDAADGWPEFVLAKVG